VALLRRAAEATTVRLAANDVIVGNRINALAVLGDFNDAPSAATTQILQGPSGSEIDTAGFDRPDAADDSRLWNLAAFLRDEDLVEELALAVVDSRKSALFGDANTSLATLPTERDVCP
jgi:hypothetical protein